MINRRNLLKGVAASAGLAMGSRAMGPWVPQAHAEGGEKSALLVIYFGGGYNSFFCSANSFLRDNTFGVTASNVTDLGNDLVVDKGSLGSMSPWAKSHMASIGVRHGISAHEAAQSSNLFDGKRNYAIALAAAMGGDAPIKCAAIHTFTPEAPRPAIGNVSLQLITDLKAVIRTLGGGPADPETPGRDVAALALEKARAMSARSIDRNPKSMANYNDGFSTGVDTLKTPLQPFNFDQLAQQYTGKATGNGLNTLDFTTRLVGAEMMIRAGANVVTIDEGGWDVHGFPAGNRERDDWARYIGAPITKFVERTQTDPLLKSMNIVVTILGDFARSLPNSDHQSNLTNTVIGKYVKVGTTGKVNEGVGLPAGCPGQLQYWAYLAEALKVKNNPFGANPHPLIL